MALDDAASIEREMQRELTPFEQGQVRYAVNRVLESLLSELLRRSQPARSVELAALRVEALQAIAPQVLRAVREDDDVVLAPGQTRGDAVAQLCCEAAMVWSMKRAGLR